MDKNIIIGIALAGFALLSVVTLTIINHSSIERVASKGFRTARETLKGKKNGS